MNSVKARIEQYAKATGKFDTICAIHAGWYYELFLAEPMAQIHGGFPYFPDAEGYLSLHLPQWGDQTDEGVPFLSVENDFGDLVHGILLRPDEWNGTWVQGFSELCTLPRFVEVFSEGMLCATSLHCRY